MKKFLSWSSKPKNNKVKELEIYSDLYISPQIDIDLQVLVEDGTVFNFQIDLFKLLSLQVMKSRECDHAGFTFILKILFFEISYMKYDTRHWDEDSEDWCKY